MHQTSSSQVELPELSRPAQLSCLASPGADRAVQGRARVLPGWNSSHPTGHRGLRLSDADPHEEQ